MDDHRRARVRRLLHVMGAVAACALVAGFAVRPRLERILQSRIEREAARRGFAARVGSVRLGLWPPLRLRDLVVEKGPLRLEAKELEVWWRGRTRLDVADAVLRGPADLSLSSEATAWDLRGAGGASWRLALVEPRPGLTIERTVSPGEEDLAIQASDLAVDRVLDVRRGDRLLLEGGTLRGALRVTDAAGVLAFDLDLASRSARLPALAAQNGEDPGLGDPTEVSVRVSGTWRRPGKTLDVPRFDAAIAGGALSGSLQVNDLGADPAVDLSLEVEKADFAALLKSAGVGSPEGMEAGLGSASLCARAHGRLSDPASFVVTQEVRYTPPATLPQSIARLRGDFVHEAFASEGDSRAVEVAPASPDYIPLDEVPPLFVRTLLLAEDAGFYGHPGIDLRELPSAVLTDLQRGGAVRGASTITQQLAKNLFLTRDKRVGRKLQEVPLALLLESALGKKRILEFYLNVIEWGPGLFGLRPAARAYFGREPRDLTPAQMAFLVSLIPAPVKYQSSFAHGTPGPGLRQLVDGLLAKLRSVDALSEEDYRAALGEAIVVQGRAPAPAAPGTTEPPPPGGGAPAAAKAGAAQAPGGR